MATETNNSITFWQALKVLAAPGAALFSVASGLLWFAGDAWIRTIVVEEIQTTGQATQMHASKIQKHASTLEQHDEEIEDNEDDIKRQDQRFTEFVSEILDRL